MAGDLRAEGAHTSIIYPLWGGVVFRKAINIAVVVAASAVLWLFFTPMYRQGEPTMAGKKAPAFSFELDGKQMQLSDLKGKVVVLNFWASWCPPCAEETPSLNGLQARIAPQGGMVLGVSVDENEAAYQKFLRDQNVSFPTWRDPQQKVNLEYGTTVFPETYIIDRGGKIARKVIGPQDWDRGENYAFLESLLQKN
jgi:cytochrome c biogenesis protein CcmG, thiol:disulfide interchange protein DsbE